MKERKARVEDALHATRAAVEQVFFFQAEDGIRDKLVTGVQTCALPISESGLSAIQRSNGAIESSHFEFRQAQIQLNSRQLGIEGKSFLIGGSCLLILLLFGENHTQTPEGGGVLGISLRDGAPCAGGFFQFSLLFEGECVGGTGVLRRRGCW